MGIFYRMDSKEDCFHLGVKVLLRNNAGKFLLLQVNTRQLKNAKEAYWDIPGGRVQKGDSLEETLQREIYEETGLQNMASVQPFMMTLSNIRIPTLQGDVGLVLSVYLSDMTDSQPVRLSEEHVNFGWFGAQEAARLLSVKYPAEFVKKLADWT